MNRIQSKKYLSLLACLCFLVACLIIGFSKKKWEQKSLLNWDISGYHLYLPASIIYQDLSDYAFYENIDLTYKPSLDVKYYAIDKHPKSGKRVNKYSMGVAYFELPAFLIAHTYAKFSSKHDADGYAAPYQFALFASTLLFVFLGLLVLRRFLILCGFADAPIAFTLLVLSLGTNLFHYTVYQPGMGHPFSFFLYSSVLLLTIKLYQYYKPKHFALLGLCIGLAILIRPVDILLIIIPLLWPLRTLRSTFQLLFTRYKLLILSAVFFALLPWIPQLIYWKYTTGQFVYYSYTNEGFNFSQPEILKGLFSFRKGWFIYTPLAFLGFVALLGTLWSKRYKNYAISVLLFYLISFWIIFSWHQWYYGGSFGSRVMINSLPLLAIPIALASEKVLKSGLVLKTVSALVISFFMFLNLFQSWQYEHTIIHWDSMNKKYYWRVFLKTEATEDDKKLI